MAVKAGPMYCHMPRNKLIEESKMGSYTLDMWLSGPLREWAKALPGEWRLEVEGCLIQASFVNAGANIN